MTLKLITKCTLSFIIVLICFNSARAQTSQNLLARFTGFSHTGNTASITVQVQATVTGEQIFAANLKFSFTGTALSFPGSPTAGTDYVWGSDFDPSVSANNYDPASTNVSELRTITSGADTGTYMSINLNNSWDGVTAQPANVELPTGSDWINVVTLYFTINDKFSSATFNFDTAAMETSPPVFDDNFDQNLENFADGGMSSFTPGSLPVTLTNFAATYANGQTRLNWTTSSEINNAYFTVERSPDGKHFEDLFNRDGAGNSNSTLHYVAYDVQPLPGISYYRPRQTDFNGADETFNIVSVYNPVLGEFSIQSVSPTNFSDNTTLYYKMPADANVQLMVTDMQGKLVADLQVPSMTGNNAYSLSNTEGWSPGVYFVDMIYDGRESHIKMVKN